MVRYTLKNFSLINLKMADYLPSITLICLIKLKRTNLRAIIDFNMPNNWQTVLDSCPITIK